jgi:hypothetical protein
MFVGILLVGIGVLMILREMGIIYGSFWEFLLPVALIALGADIVFKSIRKRF